MIQKETKAAIIIQTHWRCHKAYSYYMRFQNATIIFRVQGLANVFGDDELLKESLES